ncbi:MAG TPA: hypothetical protein VLN74_10415 [Ilumatobacteraceae bacterium]|nr:hypothetical protein [Ilumatobacteraceae bacterium]
MLEPPGAIEAGSASNWTMSGARTVGGVGVQATNPIASAIETLHQWNPLRAGGLVPDASAITATIPSVIATSNEPSRTFVRRSVAKSTTIDRSVQATFVSTGAHVPTYIVAMDMAFHLVAYLVRNAPEPRP